MISSDANFRSKGELSIEKIQFVSNVADDAEVLKKYGLERRQDGYIYWRADCRDHPRNWSTARKTFDTTVIILLEFYTTVISTTGAAAARAAGPEYNLSPRVAIIAFTFIYQLGQALGGTLIPPFSEVIGRRLPYLVSTLAFSLSCLLTAAVPSPATVWTGRFIAGFASAVPSVVIAGSVEDIFNSRRRVWIVILWNAGTTAGLCFGPIHAAYVIDAVGWRWIYYIAAIVTAALLLALCGIRESRPSRLLAAKIARVGRETGLEDLRWRNPDQTLGLAALLDVVAVRPARVLFTEPLVAMVAVISAVSWGVIYLFTEALTGIYVDMGFTATQAALPFLAIALGVLFTFLPRLWDMRVVRDRQRKGLHLQPEDKIVGFAFAAPALAIGLSWFAWTVPPALPANGSRARWLVPTAALVPIGFAVNELAYTLSGYLADSYLLYSASAFAGLAFVRAVVSGLMPLLALEMYASLNANVATTVLAGAAAVFCAAPWVFFRWSRRLRERSPFARFSLETHNLTNVEEL